MSSGLRSFLNRLGADGASREGIHEGPAGGRDVPEKAADNMIEENAQVAEEEQAPAPELRVSKAVFDPVAQKLSVNGWCLSNAEAWDLVLSVPGTELFAVVQPGTLPREDVSEKFPGFGAQLPGWSVDLDVADLPADVKVRASYVDDAVLRHHDWPITRLGQQDPHAPELRASSETSLSLKECKYSRLRNQLSFKAHLEGAAPFHGTWRVTSARGLQIEQPELSVSVRQKGKIAVIEGRCGLSGVAAGDNATVSFEGHHNLTSTPCKISDVADSEGRESALSPSVIADTGAVENAVTAQDLIKLRMHGVQPGRRVRPGTVCFYPAFDSIEELSNQYHRASWYLGGKSEQVEAVYFHRNFEPRDLVPPGEGFDHECLEPGPGFEIRDAGEGYGTTLNEAALILVWKPAGKGKIDYLKRIFPGAQVLPVATHDPSAAEYGSWCKAPWALLSGDARKALLAESHAQFRAALDSARQKGKTTAAVFGTGPSLDHAEEFDFSESMTIVCNTIVASDRLMDHIAPTFVTSGDAISHFGVSQYAARYRRDLIRRLTEQECWLLTTAAIGYVLMFRHPEIADRIILCEQTHSGTNTDLENVWSLPRFDSTLNIHMLPTAMTFSDTVFLLGFDGKNPDPTENEDFWAHSREAHYHDLVDTGHACHPTFAENRAQATAERFLASVEESFSAAECLGKRFHSLRPSFTPPIHGREVPEGWLRPTGAGGRLKPEPSPLSPASPGSRALVVMKSPRAHFSGGRYHGTMLALAMAEFCEEVVIWTNNYVPWMSELNLHPNAPRLTFLVNDFIAKPDGVFDSVILIPQLSESVLKAGFDIARRSKAKTVFVSFESPNWFNALSPDPQPAENFVDWYASGSVSDVVLCSAETAVPFAEEFHRNPFGSPAISVAPPAVNDAAVAQVNADPPDRQNQIIVFGRFGDVSSHKNLDALMDFLPDGLEGWTVALVVGTSNRIEEAQIAEWESSFNERGMHLKPLSMISDRRKFEEIARSRLMLFPTLFEGFGYPPVEAAHMGTPCVMYDLPVLKEFNADHGHFVPLGDVEALKDSVKTLVSAPPAGAGGPSAAAVCEKTTVKAFAEQIRRILDGLPEPEAGASNKAQRFEALKTYYMEKQAGPVYPLASLSVHDLQRLSQDYAKDLAVLEDTMRALRARVPGMIGGQPDR